MERIWQRWWEDTGVAVIQLLDVLLVAYLTYRLLLLVRSSRAWRVLGGIGIYMVVWWLSDRFGLRTLHFILDKGLALGPVALVILFLPELRSAIEGFGRLGFWAVRRPGTYRMSIPIIEEIVSAVTQLSQNRTGALIVVERNDLLPEVEKNGIPLDAQVSAPLLCSIFYGTNPLHDGAVIIRRDRVVAAGCMLPLSETRLRSHLHLRHRAALGITENSDAIAIVVSEERGSISLAVEGTIKEDLTPSLLREYLHQFFIEEETKKQKGKEKTDENLIVR
ncbi:MAG TPA: diadenylate cyclase CdaA [Fimbriimonadales bacterium]|nr:diadenylate cyclase CdaA [Fimbriimonadales bacterium]